MRRSTFTAPPRHRERDLQNSVPIDHYVAIGAVKTRYWQSGDSGSAVILLHGIGCSVLEWQHNIDALATRHRVFALDLMGAGLSASEHAEVLRSALPHVEVDI